MGGLHSVLLRLSLTMIAVRTGNVKSLTTVFPAFSQLETAFEICEDH